MTVQKSFWRSGKGMAACLFVAVVVYMLLMEHRAHVSQYLPFLILLLCPLMHVFMHGGHGGHDHDDHHGESPEDAYQRGLEAGRKLHEH